ncbi:MAG: methyltransferase domain-containing protein [Candidatus Hodarchaeota archaeon]
MDLLYYFKKIILYRNIAKAQEMIYWNHEIKYNSETFLKKDLYNREPDIKFALNLIKTSFNVSGRNIKILEIGPGPRSGLRKGYESGDFDLIGIDPLANDYKKEFNGGNFLRFGFGEDVGTMFKPNSFHIIYASNSLDHCKNPIKVIEGVLQILKGKGLLIICGNEREGLRSLWIGFHKHDLWIEKNNLLCCDENGKTSILTDGRFSLIKKRSMIYEPRNRRGDKIKWFLGIWEKTHTV